MPQLTNNFKRRRDKPAPLIPANDLTPADVDGNFDMVEADLDILNGELTFTANQLGTGSPAGGLAAQLAWILTQIGTGTPGATALTAPTGAALTALSATTAGLSWNPVAGSSGYTYQYATNAGFTAGLQTITVGAGVTSASLSGLVASTLYYSRVKALGTGSYSDSPYGSAVSATTQAAGGGGTGQRLLVVTDGDSRTQPVSADKPWVIQLEESFAGSTVPIDWLHLGVGGTFTEDALARNPAIIDAYDPAVYSACISITMSGINDFHWSSHAGNTDTAPSKANHEALVRGRAAAGIKVIFVTDTHIRDTGSAAIPYTPYLLDLRNHSAANWQAWGAAAFVDLWNAPLLQNGRDANIIPDGIHLNEYGNHIITREVRRKLATVMTSLGLPVAPFTFTGLDTAVESTVLSSLPRTNAEFTDLATATATGNSLVLNGQGSAHSTMAVQYSSAPVSGGFEFTVGSLSGQFWVWLSSNASAQSGYDDMEFGLFFNGGTIGPWGNATGPFQERFPVVVGDVLTVQEEKYGQWTIYKNGTKVDTWANKQAADTDLLPAQISNQPRQLEVSGSGTLNSVKLLGELVAVNLGAPGASTYYAGALEDVTWTDMSQWATASGSSLTVQYSVSYARSTRAIGPSAAALRGVIEFTVDQPSDQFVFGVNPTPGAETGNYGDIPAGILMYGGGYRALGTTVGDSYIVQPCVAGDVLRMQIEAGRISLYRNGQFVISHDSNPALSTEPLFIDLGGVGAGVVRNAKIYAVNPL